MRAASSMPRTPCRNAPPSYPAPTQHPAYPACTATLPYFKTALPSPHPKTRLEHFKTAGQHPAPPLRRWPPRCLRAQHRLAPAPRHRHRAPRRLLEPVASPARSCPRRAAAVAPSWLARPRLRNRRSSHSTTARKTLKVHMHPSSFALFQFTPPGRNSLPERRERMCANVSTPCAMGVVTQLLPLRSRPRAKKSSPLEPPPMIARIRAVHDTEE